MKRRVLLLSSLFLVLLLVFYGCGKKEEIRKIDPTPPVEVPKPEPPVEEKKPEVPVPVGCTTNTECMDGKVCIDSKCGTVASLFKTEGCSQKCNFGTVVVTTSDGETYTITKGQGSYTAAGALQWTVRGGTDYCASDNIVVPFEVKMVNYGETLKEYYVTLNEGETSEILEYPLQPDLDFTVTLKSLEEKCS